MLELRTLGAVGIHEGSTGLLAASPKPLALLVYLAVARPRGPQRRDTLLALFHPELDHRHARMALRQLTHALRAVVGPDAVRSERQTIGLDPERFTCDVHAFEAAIAEGDHAGAVAAYGGPFLSGFFLSGCPEFERWVEAERHRLERAYAGALERLALAADATGDAQQAVALWQQLADVDPYATRVTVRLIAALEVAGDRAGALHVAERHGQRLKEELAAEPAPDVEALARRLRLEPAPSTPAPAGTTRERLTRAVAGRYRVNGVAGAGGMALVYRADDLKLGRPVALKVLRPELAAAMGHERFLNEVDIAASLAHPNILPLHDAGEADGLLYYVMPYVEGESLRARLARDGTLSVAEAVRITSEVADALAHAHERGIVHRDIKPANILLLADHAVVSDFGVARALGEATEERALLATTGTPAYMSPEQAAGSPDVDGRSDLYSLGCVLHEMVTGMPPPFVPQSPALPATTAAEPVPPAEEPVPVAVRKALATALAPNPIDRFASARELAAALADVRSTPRLWRRARWATLAAAALAAGVGVVLMATNKSLGMAPHPQSRQLTFEGNVTRADLSPDGRWLAYAVRDDSVYQIMVRDLAGESSLALTDSAAFVSTLRWSPDGTQLLVGGLFRGQWVTYAFPHVGGVPRVLSRGGGRLWSSDGTRLAAWGPPVEQGLWVSDLASGGQRHFAIPGTDPWVGDEGDWANHRDLIALVTYSGDDYVTHLWVLSLNDSSHVLTLVDSASIIRSPRWAPNDDAVYFVKSQSLFRIDVDPSSGQARRGPQHIVQLEGMEPLTSLPTPISVSGDNQRLVYTRTTEHVNFSVVREAGGHIERVVLTTGTARKGCPALSPDGTAVAFTQTSDKGLDLYCVAASGGAPRRLTFDGSVASCPAWAPSGRHLAYRAGGASGNVVAIIGATGGKARTYEDARAGPLIAWAPGPRIAYQAMGNRNFWLLDPETGEQEPLVRNDSAGWMGSASLSPDGNAVAVSWNRHDGRGLWLISLVDGSQRRLYEPAEQSQWSVLPVGWSEDGKSVYARGTDRVVRRFPLTGGDGEVVLRPAGAGPSCLPHERAGGLIWVCPDHTVISDVWMIENFDPEYARPQR